MKLPPWYGKMLNAVMVAAGLAVTDLAPYYGGQRWFPVVVACLAALGIHGTFYQPPSAP